MLPYPSTAGTVPRRPQSRDERGRFRLGSEGGPGKPRGARRLLAEQLDKVCEAQAVAILDAMCAKALGGDLDAGKFILSRAWPARTGRRVQLHLPADDQSPQAVLAAALDAVTRGDLTPGEAEAIAHTVEAHGRALDATAMKKLETLTADPPSPPRPRLAAA